jgi:hypothetical protein
MDTPYSTSNSSTTYCLGRMVGKVGIARIGIVVSLEAAEARMKEIIETCPGQYIVFCQRTGRVVAQTR